jgi:hypothetical protein
VLCDGEPVALVDLSALDEGSAKGCSSRYPSSGVLAAAVFQLRRLRATVAGSAS